MHDFATRYQPACLTCAERAEAEAMRMDAEAAAEARQEAHAARADRLHAALSRLLRAYPRLASEFSTSEQQAAYRVAVCALEECGRG